MLAFLWLNSGAYDGFFQDDELDNLSWAPYLGLRQYAIDFLKPLFDVSNFRPAGHLYFTLMGRMFGMDFPPYMTPIFLLHLLNCTLLFALFRKLGVGVWQALAAAAFFGLSSSAMDAYWKPMYVFDLVCTTFCLTSLLLFTYRRWVLSFIAYWLAYKAKELAVMLPFVLLAYEYWLGQRRFLVLIPFFLTSLSFGLQGILLNPNHDNDYTFSFTLDAIRKTAPFYARRFLFFRMSALLLLSLVLLRDRRIWLGIFAMCCFLFTLLFLPGRLFEAYFYLPLACASIAVAASFSRIHPVCAWAFIGVWSIFNVHHLRAQQREKLRFDDRIYAFVTPLQRWAVQHPAVSTLIFANPPAGFHDWGIGAAWNIAHHTLGLKAIYQDSPAAAPVLAKETVAIATWNEALSTMTIQIHSPQ